MKSFIALSCLLVVAAATPYNSYGYKFLSDKKSAPASTYSTKTYSNGAKHGGYTSTYASKNTYSGSSAFSGFDLNTIMEYVNDPYYALEKSQGLLEQLNEGLPDALAKMDPSIKNDIKEVNGLILEICDKAAANAKPATINSYYSPEGIKKTCDFLHKHVPEISRGLDEPQVISNLIEKLAEFGRLSKAMADLF